ncbi:MAG: D-2-hydroxyacid dehydrogenase [Candidatus Cloacimonetes bacterium]|nr:D-2-hydroxyacid dehydrogenase [Candidatus Cloacimonadota bacterium]
MPRVLLNDGLSASAIEALERLGVTVDTTHYTGDDLLAQLKLVDAVVVRSATQLRDPEVDAAAAGHCRLFIRGGVGIDNINHAYAAEKGIAVRNTPGASSASVAELVIAHMFAVSRWLPDANVTMRQGQWNKKRYEGRELNGATLGVIGFGRIGRETAKRALALGMSVVYCDSYADIAPLEGATRCSLKELLPQSDYISLNVPHSKGAPPLIGAAELATMKPDAILVNCSRGGTVDEAALLAALEVGKLGGAGIDVFASEPGFNQALAAHPRVSVTPHIGAQTGEAQDRIGGEVVEIIAEVLGL